METTQAPLVDELFYRNNRDAGPKRNDIRREERERSPGSITVPHQPPSGE